MADVASGDGSSATARRSSSGDVARVSQGRGGRGARRPRARRSACTGLVGRVDDGRAQPGEHRSGMRRGRRAPVVTPLARGGWPQPLRGRRARAKGLVWSSSGAAGGMSSGSITAPPSTRLSAASGHRRGAWRRTRHRPRRSRRGRHGAAARLFGAGGASIDRRGSPAFVGLRPPCGRASSRRAADLTSVAPRGPRSPVRSRSTSAARGRGQREPRWRAPSPRRGRSRGARRCDRRRARRRTRSMSTRRRRARGSGTGSGPRRSTVPSPGSAGREHRPQRVVVTSSCHSSSRLRVKGASFSATDGRKAARRWRVLDFGRLDRGGVARSRRG